MSPLTSAIGRDTPSTTRRWYRGARASDAVGSPVLEHAMAIARHARADNVALGRMTSCHYWHEAGHNASLSASVKRPQRLERQSGGSSTARNPRADLLTVYLGDVGSGGQCVGEASAPNRVGELRLSEECCAVEDPDADRGERRPRDSHLVLRCAKLRHAAGRPR